MNTSIESAVRARDSKHVKNWATRFLKKSHRSIASRLVVADVFRRMGWFREAYLIAEPDRWSTQAISTSEPRGMQQLTCARLVNLLGGTPLALSMLTRIVPETAKDHRIFANIYLSAFYYEPALQYFQKSIHLEKYKEAYDAKLARVGEADCLAYLGQVEKALKILTQIKTDSSETLLKGIIAQARGEYLCLAKKWKEAEKSLSEALKYFPEGESPDHGFLFKWLGYAYAKLGRITEAKGSFQRALFILKRPGIRAETWLDTFRLMHDVGLLSNEETFYLRAYPGLSPVFTDKASEVAGLNEMDLEISEWWISETRDEYRLLEKRYVGLPKEVKLLSLLKRAGKHGIGMTRLEALLWGEEIGSFPMLDQRLHLLLNRIKKVYRFSPEIRDRVVSLGGSDLLRISVEFSLEPKRLLFFESHSEFSSLEFREFYTLGKTQALARLKLEVKSEVIEPIPGTHGPRTRYQKRRS